MKLKYSSLLRKFSIILILVVLFNVLNFIFLEKIITPTVSDRILKENASIADHLALHTEIIIDEAVDSLLITAQSSDIRGLGGYEKRINRLIYNYFRVQSQMVGNGSIFFQNPVGNSRSDYLFKENKIQHVKKNY